MNTRRKFLQSAAVLGLAAGASVLIAMLQPAAASGRFWGLWLYLGLMAGMLILEGSALAAGRKPPG